VSLAMPSQSISPSESRRYGGVELLRVAQRAPADEVTDEVALRHVRSYDRNAGLGLVRGNKTNARFIPKLLSSRYGAHVTRAVLM
jgi:hypothetical protein